MAALPAPDEDTLDEPVTDTLARDLKAIGRKTLLVLVPCIGGDKELKDWDLWGPLVFCMALAMTLGITAAPDDKSTVFAAVFIIVWAGSAIVTINAKLLGAKVSFLQSVCAMGYCIAPMCISSILSLILPSGWLTSTVLGILSFTWATYASLRFFRGAVKPDREALVVYPMGLFYFFMAWMMAVGS